MNVKKHYDEPELIVIELGENIDTVTDSNLDLPAIPIGSPEP